MFGKLSQPLETRLGLYRCSHILAYNPETSKHSYVQLPFSLPLSLLLSHSSTFFVLNLVKPVPPKVLHCCLAFTFDCQTSRELPHLKTCWQASLNWSLRSDHKLGEIHGPTRYSKVVLPACYRLFDKRELASEGDV